MSRWRRARKPDPDPATDELVQDTEAVKARLVAAVRVLGHYVDDLRAYVAQENDDPLEDRP